MAATISTEAPADALSRVWSIPLPDDSASPTGGAFVAGVENQVVAAVVAEFLKPDACAYSPLIIHGASGTGKSRLARGILQEWLERSGEDQPGGAGGECIAAIDLVNDDKAPSTNTAREATRFLIVEDLLQIADKPGHQAVLLRWLDAIADAGGRAIVTSRVSPRDIAALAPALKSRLAGGLNLPLALPGPEARRTILENIAAERGIAIASAAVAALDQAIRGPAPELIGAMLSLENEAPNREIELADVRRFLAGQTPRQAPSMSAIAAATARSFSVRVTDLKSASRRQSLVRARGVAMYLARRLTNLSFEQIGAYFGGRDHTTVLHGCRKTEEWIAEDQGVRHTIQQLREALAFE